MWRALNTVATVYNTVIFFISNLKNAISPAVLVQAALDLRAACTRMASVKKTLVIYCSRNLTPIQIKKIPKFFKFTHPNIHFRN